MGRNPMLEPLYQMPPKRRYKVVLKAYGSSSSSSSVTSSSCSSSDWEDHHWHNCGDCRHEAACLDRILRTGKCTAYEKDERKFWGGVGRKVRQDIPGAEHDVAEYVDPGPRFEKNWLWRKVNEICGKINERFES